MPRTSANRISSALKVGALIRKRTAANGRRDTGKIAVLDRATALLVALSHFTRPATLNEVAQKADLSKATAFRILSTLSEQGFVEQDASTASYRLGIAPLQMAMAVLDGIDVHAKARPVMRTITETLNETVVLSVRDRDHRVNIDAVECTNAIGSSRRIGEPRPLHSGAASRVHLAVMSDAEIESYLKRHRPTAKGEAGPAFLDNLWKDIRKARRTGLVSMPADFSPESMAVATIVYDPAGEPIAALHVAIPRGRFSPRVEQRCGQALLRAASEITRELKP
jgi:IclR family acetate operon transcriptional repressor